MVMLTMKERKKRCNLYSYCFYHCSHNSDHADNVRYRPQMRLLSCTRYLQKAYSFGIVTMYEVYTVVVKDTGLINSTRSGYSTSYALQQQQKNGWWRHRPLRSCIIDIEILIEDCADNNSHFGDNDTSGTDYHTNEPWKPKYFRMTSQLKYYSKALILKSDKLYI